MESEVPPDELDAVAAYVQAARELKASAYFHEDYHRLRVTTVGGRLESVEFPDPNVRDAMLISFRRLWAEGEPSNYIKVANILARRITHWRAVIKELKAHYQRALAEYSFVGPISRPEALSPNDVLDLWINARFFHSGKTGRVGRFTRDDFEAFRRQIGDVQFEYLFLLALWQVGLNYGNLLWFAEDVLNHWRTKGLVPSFQIDTVTARGGQISSDGIRIERVTPGWSVTHETPADRVSRLLRRRRFDAFRSLLELLRVENDRVAIATAASESVNELCTSLGFSIKDADGIDFNCIDAGTSFCDDRSTVMKNGRNRVGAVGRQGSQLLVSGDAIPILTDQFAAFRREFGSKEELG